MSDLSDAIFGIAFIGGILIFIGLIGLGVYSDIVTSEGTITVTEKIGAHGDEGRYLIIAHIWEHIRGDCLPSMRTLRNRFRKVSDWQGIWCYEYAKQSHRQILTRIRRFSS